MRTKLLTGLLTGLLPLAANAIPIAGDFTGTVWRVTDGGAPVPGDITPSTAVTGSFQFENTGQAPLVQLDSLGQSTYDSTSAGSFFQITVGGLFWNVSGVSVVVRNDSGILGDDMLEFVYSGSLPLLDPAFPPASSFPGSDPGATNSSFAISLFDTSTMNLVSSQALPASASDINLPAVNYQNGSIFGATGPNTYYQIDFTVDSVKLHDVPVPEPDTASLLAAGLLAAGLLVRRRHPKRAWSDGPACA